MLSWPQKIPKPSAPSSPSRALIDKYELVMQGFLKAKDLRFGFLEIPGDRLFTRIPRTCPLVARRRKADLVSHHIEGLGSRKPG
jgi:hypothetical protein